MALPAPSSKTTALVTGASSGIGADIARELAARGHGLTLVARREGRLRELQAELNARYNVRIEVVTADLSEGRARELMAAQVGELELTVDVLVNNAGFGSGGRFFELDRDREQMMVRTNVEAIVDLCGRYVPQMTERGRGAVMNVASTAGFQPLPRQATYSASKAFVLAFTEVLASDLKGTGVTATCLCPGPVRSEFTQAPGFEQTENVPGFMWMSSEDCARAAVKGLERGRRVVVPGAANLVGAIAGQHAPRNVLLALLRRLSPIGK